MISVRCDKYLNYWYENNEKIFFIVFWFLSTYLGVVPFFKPAAYACSYFFLATIFLGAAAAAAGGGTDATL